MTRKALDWFQDHGDSLFALLISLVVGVLGTFGVVDQEIVSGAILATLAVLAVGMLRDRSRQSIVDEKLDRLSGSTSGITVLEGKAVGLALRAAREHTDVWYFRGGTGTFTRAVTLPSCIDQVLERRGRLDVRLEVIDPADTVVCESYAAFRSSFEPKNSAGGETWTVERTRMESFATVLAACWYKQLYPDNWLHIQVALLNRYTKLRFDLSSSCLVITQDDPARPALRIDSSEPFYGFYHADLASSFEQSRSVPVVGVPQLRQVNGPTPQRVRDLFDAVGLPLPASYSDADVDIVVEKAIRATHPYP